MKFLSKEEEEKHLLDAHGVVKGLLLDCGQCQQQFAETTKFRKTIKNIAFIICLYKKKFQQHQIIITSILFYNIFLFIFLREHFKLPHPHHCADCEHKFVTPQVQFLK